MATRIYISSTDLQRNILHISSKDTAISRNMIKPAITHIRVTESLAPGAQAQVLRWRFTIISADWHWHRNFKWPPPQDPDLRPQLRTNKKITPIPTPFPNLYLFNFVEDGEIGV